MTVDDFLRGAGLAADVIAVDVGLFRSADLGIEPHQIAHLVAGLGFDDTRSKLHRIGLATPEERRRNEIAAINDSVDAHYRLQRRDRKPMPECDGDGVQFGPMLRHNRLGAFRQFRAQTVELAQLFQKCFVSLDTLRQRDARSTDVRRIGENFGE